MKKILDLWSEFLMRPESCKVLTPRGWLGMSSMDDFKHDKKKKYYGFKCWNDFFIRRFKNIEQSRPMSDALVVSACDAIFVTFKKNIKYTTDFMRVKGDIYSLKDTKVSEDRLSIYLKTQVVIDLREEKDLLKRKGKKNLMGKSLR